jgi:UDP-N-acetylmuramate--alanine ligase
LELAGVPREEAAAALGEFTGTARRFEPRGEVAGVAVYDDYAHHPTELEALVSAAREQGVRRVLVLFQPHLYSRTRHLAAELGRALATADAAYVTEIYRAREEPIDGVTGKLVVEAAADARPGLPVGWTPDLEDGARLLARRARPGDAVLTVGAGDVDRAVPLILAELERR